SVLRSLFYVLCSTFSVLRSLSCVLCSTFSVLRSLFCALCPALYIRILCPLSSMPLFSVERSGCQGEWK
ncbi:MAG: hypothetical protein ACI4U2_05010, partial [Christensenellaceae bacterium]